MLTFNSLEEAQLYTGNEVVCIKERLFKRHTNLNGDLGGYVEDTASVESTCYVGFDCIVFDYAEMYEYAKIYNNSRMYNKSSMFGSAEASQDTIIYDRVWIYNKAKIFKSEISDNVRIYNNAEVMNAVLFGNIEVYNYAKIIGRKNTIFIYDSLCVGLDSYIETTSDYFYVCSVHEQNHYMTLTKNTKNEVLVKVDRFTGSEKKFLKMLNRENIKKEYIDIYKTLISIFKNRIKKY